MFRKKYLPFMCCATSLKNNLIFGLLIFFGLLLPIASCNCAATSQKENEDKLEATKAFAAHDLAMMRDPILGEVPSQRLLQAKNFKDSLMAHSPNLTLNDLNWRALGPKNQGGRTRCVMVDRNDATGNTVFAASVSGGLWKTTNALATQPTWAAVNNFLDNLSITYLLQHPAQPQIMYLCTGEAGYSNIDGLRGLGVFKSTNAGTTWTQLPATNLPNFYQCFKMAITQQGDLFVATTTGLYRSNNSGGSFTKVLGANMGITNAVSNFCYDVDVASNGTVYATLKGSIHRSNNNGLSFENGFNLPIFASRIELDVAKQNSNLIWALVELNDKVYGIITSSNGGNTWHSKPEPVDADNEIPNTDFSRLQAWYDLTIAIDPNDENTIYLGGINLFKSTDGGSNWEQLSHWYGGFGKQYVHADQHMILFHPTVANTCFFANDGGVARSLSTSATIPTIVDISTNYISTQFYACAITPIANKNYFLAGSQDNGTQVFTKAIAQNTTQVTGADGMFCHIDANEPNIQFTSFQYSNYNRSVDNGNHWETISTSNGNFINVTDYDDINNMMFLANSVGTYKRWDNASSGNSFTEFNLPVDNYHNMVAAISVSPNQTNTVYFGMDDGKLVRATNAHTASPQFVNIGSGLPNGYISCVTVQPGNENRLVVTLSNYGINSVWQTQNGGVSWQNIEGNLPDIPVRWVVIDPNNSQGLILATELGVWATDFVDGADTQWMPANSGLANVRVNMIAYRASDHVLIAATHGRGLFMATLLAPTKADFECPAPTSYAAVPIQFFNTSNNSQNFLWNFGDGTSSTDENPTHSYAGAGTYDVTLTINGGAASTAKNKFVQILPRRATPYTLNDGGNFESNLFHFGKLQLYGTQWELGASAINGKNGLTSGNNGWVTGLSENYLNNTLSYLLSPNFNFTNTGQYFLKFKAKWNFQNPMDGVGIEYTKDSGRTWQTIPPTLGVGGFNYSNNNPNVVTSFPLGQPFITNMSNGFEQKQFDVTSLGGNRAIAFRFAIKSNSNTSAPGIVIDDFEIDGVGNTILSVLDAKLFLHLSGPTNMLSWQINDATLFKTIEMEHSEDGQRFNKIYTITNQLLSYNHVAKKQSKANYYRLKLTKQNGSLSWSNIVFSANSNSDRPFYNFQQSESTISFDLYESNMRLAILNSSGQIIWLNEQNTKHVVINTKPFPRGAYFLLFSSKQQSFVKKVSF